MKETADGEWRMASTCKNGTAVRKDKSQPSPIQSTPKRKKKKERLKSHEHQTRQRGEKKRMISKKTNAIQR